MRDTDTANYVVRDHPVLGRRLWWAPPGGVAWEPLPLAASAATAVKSSAHAVAEAILLHASGDFAAARDHAAAFRSDVLDRSLAAGEVHVPGPVVEGWLAGRGLALVPGWGPLGPTPMVECVQLRAPTERYTVTLDGWELLRVDVEDGSAIARVEVPEVDRPGLCRWSGTVVIAEAADGHEQRAPTSRVTTESLPFGGWAVQADEFDIVILERDPTRPTHARVAVYDRGRDGEFLRFDEPVPYRQFPTEPPSISERLRLFSAAPPGRERVLGR